MPVITPSVVICAPNIQDLLEFYWNTGLFFPALEDIARDAELPRRGHYTAVLQNGEHLVICDAPVLTRGLTLTLHVRHLPHVIRLLSAVLAVSARWQEYTARRRVCLVRDPNGNDVFLCEDRQIVWSPVPCYA